MSDANRLVVLISGGGTNLQALIDAIARGELPAYVAAVISNRADAFGLVRAARANIPSAVLPAKPFPDRPAYDDALAELVASFEPDLIVLAGFMRLLTPVFLDRFPRRVINLHPALPGQFAGIRAIERAYAAWQAGAIAVSGCMVHYVVPEVDAGPVIATREVPFREGESLEQYAAHLHTAEHELIVAAVGKVLGDRIES